MHNFYFPDILRMHISSFLSKFLIIFNSIFENWWLLSLPGQYMSYQLSYHEVAIRRKPHGRIQLHRISEDGKKAQQLPDRQDPGASGFICKG